MSDEFIAGQGVALKTRSVPVERLLCGNASVMTGPGTNTYLIGHQRMAVLDPGPADEDHLSAILDALAGRKLETIFVTHTHSDHSPGTALLQARTGASLVGLPAPATGHHDETFKPDRPFADGERLDCGEYTMMLVHTPGHVSNHFCYLLEEEGLLFTGDHILEGMTPVILPPDGDMGQYLASLARLADMPLTSLAPGHGRQIHEPAKAIKSLIRHRQLREQKVLRCMRAASAMTLNELVLQVYDDVPEHLLKWAKRTLLAHLLKLEAEGQVQQVDETWHVC